MNENICIIGLGYVGLPLAVAFAQRDHDVVGYDIDSSKVAELKNGIDPTRSVSDEVVSNSTAEFTSDETSIGRADYVIVAVPTPIDALQKPNLEHVEASARTIGRHLREGATAVLESTVYPGATRELFAPTIEETSGLTAGEDFYFGYSPERLVPGDDEHGLDNVVKVVSGQTAEVLDDLEALYSTIVSAEVHRAPDIEIAEAAKCLENIQRDLNIALINELAVISDIIGLDTHAILDAAKTKWNFHEYRPGFVGGHCIPVDPFFMIYESKRNGFTPQLMEKGREVNDYLPKYVGDLTLKGLNECGKVLRESTVLVLGLAYKPNVSDVRTSAVGGFIEKLELYDVNVVGYDPHAAPDEVRAEFGIPVREDLSFEGVDAAVLATPHDELRALEYDEAAEEMAADPLVVDVMGVLDAERLESSERLAYIRL